MSISEKLTTIAENTPKVYNAGYEKGYEQSKVDNVKEEQEKTVDITENGTTEILPDESKVLSKVTVNVDVADSYYNIFWDAYQQNGERTNYASAFNKDGQWYDKMFKPKYDIKPVGSTRAMFNLFQVKEDGCGDLGQLLSNCGVVLDTSQATDLFATFQSCQFTFIPHLDLRNCGDLTTSFYDANKLETIEKLTLSAHTTYHQCFWICNSLKNITIEGEIGTNFEIKPITLTAESAKSVLTHLVNYAGTENEFKYTVSLASNVWDLLNAEGNTSPNGGTWLEYTTKLGWLT